MVRSIPGEQPSADMVAEYFAVDPSGASRMVADALRGGYVRRVASQTDGRRMFLELTDNGRKLLRTASRFRKRFLSKKIWIGRIMTASNSRGCQPDLSSRPRVFADARESGGYPAAKEPNPCMAKRTKVTRRIQHHKDGSIWSQGAMKDGRMHGYWEWFRSDGTKMRSGHFACGERVGEWITYDKRGSRYKTTMISDR